MARALITKQKHDMLALIKKMREMHFELKTLRAAADCDKAHKEASCQTYNALESEEQSVEKDIS